MAWGPWLHEDLEEDPGAGDGDATAEIKLNPGEKAHVFVERTDAAAAGDGWLIAIQGSIEDTPNWAENPPMREYRLEDTQLEKTFIVSGVYAFRIYFQNDGTDTDKVAATVGWRKDGVSI
jgi:hypothetical protein